MHFSKFVNMRVTAGIFALNLLMKLLLLILEPGESKAEILVLKELPIHNVTTTTRIENFISQNTRQYETICHIMEIYLTEFKSNYDERLDTLGMNVGFLEIQLNDVEQFLNPLELLDDVHNFCVHKYTQKLPDLTSIKNNMANCLSRGHAFYESIVLPAASTYKNLKSHYVVQYQTALQECAKKYTTEPANYTSCVITTIKLVNQLTTTNINLFHNQLKQASFTASIKIKEAFDCHSAIVYSSLTKIGAVVGLVDSCAAGHEFCPKCSLSETSSNGRCPYVMNLHLTEQELGNERIPNPFKGVSKATPCLKILFSNRNSTNE